jgi:hypothetical protein
MGFDDEDSMVQYITKNASDFTLGGIVFTNLSLESNITYKIRLSAKLRNSGKA